jgi:hypothetical protein
MLHALQNPLKGLIDLGRHALTKINNPQTSNHNI